MTLLRLPLQYNHFTPFQQSIALATLPERFTFPYYYQPHPLCLLAVKELQAYLTNQTQWRHNFGLTGEADSAIGKMFGVLLVQNKHGEIGYLSAFSGKLADSNHLPKFVPPVFDMLAENSFFLTGQKQINLISAQIKILEKNPNIALLKSALKDQALACASQIDAHRQLMIAGRKTRKIKRTEAEKTLNTESFLQLKQQLSKQSIEHKNQLRDLTLYWNACVENAQRDLAKIMSELTTLRHQRKALSVDLQQQLFENYRFLNNKGIVKNLAALFEKTAQHVPPAGAGECAAPKLLQYAFQHEMKPLAMAEFWWGVSPKSEIRQHLNFYGACLGKCQPILAHMLDGISLDENPLLTNPAAGKTIDIVYEDEEMLVINKPADFLSVPGKSIEDSVYLRMKQAYPLATGPLIVHRLDMSTSGLMVIALSKESHKNLQKQFINRKVKKRYIALLDGVLKQQAGVIDLPLRVDLDDRPRQLVCYDYGKVAKTNWQKISQTNQQTKVYFYPITGRTHQLRVHSAHIKGLKTPIVGDDLYGNKSTRLHLHAESLSLAHPLTKTLMNFQVDAEF